MPLPRVSKETVASWYASVQDVTNRKKYTMKFWNWIEKEQEPMLEHVLLSVNEYNTDKEREAFCNGFWAGLELLRRQTESDELNNLKV